MSSLRVLTALAAAALAAACSPQDAGVAPATPLTTAEQPADPQPAAGSSTPMSAREAGAPSNDAGSPAQRSALSAGQVSAIQGDMSAMKTLSANGGTVATAGSRPTTAEIALQDQAMTQHRETMRMMMTTMSDRPPPSTSTSKK